MSERNAIWSYVSQMAQPVLGPQPRLAIGTGATGGASRGNNAAGIPGYMSSQDYEPQPFTYAPPNNPVAMHVAPQSIGVGDDGLHALNPTYRAHDFTPATRFINHLRSAPPWQVQMFPAQYRNTLQYQQVQRYRVHSQIMAARPLARSDYFLGYQIDQTVAGQLGMNNLGSM